MFQKTFVTYKSKEHVFSYCLRKRKRGVCTLMKEDKVKSVAVRSDNRVMNCGNSANGLYLTERVLASTSSDHILCKATLNPAKHCMIRCQTKSTLMLPLNVCACIWPLLPRRMNEWCPCLSSRRALDFRFAPSVAMPNCLHNAKLSMVWTNVEIKLTAC